MFNLSYLNQVNVMNSLKVFSILLLALAGFVHVGEAKTTCSPTPQPGVQRCVSEVDFARFTGSFATQKMSQWCWAASISMIFDYHGHPLSQEKIVQAQYGRIINLPAMNGLVISSNLNRRWVDDNGERFASVLTAAYDPESRVYAMNNYWIINQLDNELPFIIGFGGHAVVATRIDYYRSMVNGSIQVDSLGVFDPWPGNGARTLRGLDILPAPQGGKLQYAASASITTLR